MPHKTSDDPEVRRSSSSSEEARAHEQQRLRRLPSVEWLRRRVTMDQAGEEEGQEPDPRLTHVARDILDSARIAIRRGETAPTREELVAAMRARLEEARAPYLREVINATGVIVHTNLGRAPLSERAIEQVVAIARGYSNLEFDLAAGARGSRLVGVRQALCDLTGAEDAVVVNNNAAAVLLTLAALAAGREVIVSRGELVEIGGGFRIPEVLEQSSARLVEVGTTNKTHLRDYEWQSRQRPWRSSAYTPATFASSVSPRRHRLRNSRLSRMPLASYHIHDLGSGALFDTERWGLAHEPTARESLAAGVDIVCFSADKLLGGPQAGVILGRRALLARIERHPLMRAVRSDKLTLAALEATLQQHLAGVAARDIPVARTIAARWSR